MMMNEIMSINLVSDIGKVKLLDNNKLAFFCSTTCPGDIILKIYKFADSLSGSHITLISGFHSPVEQGLLDMLIRRKHPVIICPARSIEGMRIPKKWRQGIDEGWMQVVSPFEKKHRRMTAELAEQRNRFIADLSDEILIAHASPGGKLEKFALELIEEGKRVWTFESEWNRGLVERGARIMRDFSEIIDRQV